MLAFPSHQLEPLVPSNTTGLGLSLKFQIAAIFKADPCVGRVCVLYRSSEAEGNLGVAFVHGCLLFPFADDHSRVRLQMLEGDNNSDYINGNYIDVCILKLSVNPDILTHTTPQICCTVSSRVSVTIHKQMSVFPTLHRVQSLPSQVSLFGDKHLSLFLYPLHLPKLRRTKKIFFTFLSTT